MQHKFFEGSEKKFEVVVSANSPDLRSLGEQRWREIVTASGAHVLSRMRGAHCDAYLLSESSLFVFAHKVVMITCGRTRLVDAVAARYAGWQGELGQAIMAGERTLADLHQHVLETPEPVRQSGRQEMLENIVARYVERAR